MMFQIWTIIVVASLILLGDSALASEINHRSDAEAVASGTTVQVSQPESPDDSVSRWQPILTGANSIQTKVNNKYKTLAPVVRSIAYTSKYGIYNPRAPPVPTK